MHGACECSVKLLSHCLAPLLEYRIAQGNRKRSINNSLSLFPLIQLTLDQVTQSGGGGVGRVEFQIVSTSNAMNTVNTSNSVYPNVRAVDSRCSYVAYVVEEIFALLALESWPATVNVLRPTM
jgi:hypothetical protein